MDCFLKICSLFVLLAFTDSTVDDYCDTYHIGKLGRGVITHSNYPFDYITKRNCRHRIYVDDYENPDPGYRDRTICFTFRRFSLVYSESCTNDYLEVQQHNPITKYCGAGIWNLGNPVQYLSNVFAPTFCWPVNYYFDVIFRSDTALNDHGYYAEYQIYTGEEPTPSPPTVPPGCDPPDMCTQYCYHGYELDGTGCPTCTCLIGSEAPCDGSSQYTCFNRKCIPRDQKCNGVDDCGDNSDEGYLHARCDDAEPNTIEACSFEDPSASTLMCGFQGQGWIHDITSPAGPRFDHTTGVFGGHFLYAYFMNTRSPLIRYQQTPINGSQDHCLVFWYFMSGNVGTLNLYLNNTNNITTSPVWHRTYDYGSQWRQAEVNIPADVFPLDVLAFECREEDMQMNNIGLDDITLTPGECFGDDISCTFELGYCGWTNDSTEAGWQRHRGPTPSRDTGPLTDHSDGGYYVYLEAADHPYNTSARLISRMINHGFSKTKCLKFWYHMYGADVHTLTVITRSYSGVDTEQWMRHGNHGNQWIKGQISMAMRGGPFQLIFEARVGSSRFSDIALDDVQLTPGHCWPDPPTPTSTRLPVPSTCAPNQFRCDDGTCIKKEFVCDGSFDCDDRSDETDCAVRNTSTAVIVGISVTCGLLLILAIAIALTLLYQRRKHRRETTQNNQDPLGLQNPVVRYFNTGPEVDDGGYPQQGPPPLYTPSDNHVPSASGSTATLTVSISYPSYEPPPSYDIAIRPRGRAPSYTDEDAPSYAESQGEPISLDPSARRSRNKQGQGQRSRDSSRESVRGSIIDVGDTSLTGQGAMGDLVPVVGSATMNRRLSSHSQNSLPNYSTV